MIDHTNGRVLEVLESRDKQTLIAWLRSAVESGLLGALEEATTDMWDGYVEAVKEVFGPRVRLTIDRFHVMKNFQVGLDQSRRQIQRELPEEEARALKGTRWVWLTNLENLEPQQIREWESLKARFPRLAALSAQRESLRQIFEDRTITTASQGVVRLQEWCRQARALGYQGLQTFCKTLDHWMDKIANYFVSRSSNGQTEGFNRGIRAILWRAFGIPNFAHLRLRILHYLG